MAREAHKEKMRRASLERLNEPDEALTKLQREVELKKQGYDRNEDGDWFYTPPKAALPDEIKDLNSAMQYLQSDVGRHLVAPGQTVQEAARELLGIKVRNAGLPVGS